jgi:hypothetical protein
MWITKRIGIFRHIDSEWVLIPTIIFIYDHKYMAETDINFRFLNVEINIVIRHKNNFWNKEIENDN